jgi:hypothetical protein
MSEKENNKADEKVQEMKTTRTKNSNKWIEHVLIKYISQRDGISV